MMNTKLDYLKQIVLHLLAWILCSPIFAADGSWPQWRGPNRDGHAAPQSLLKKWPEKGPALSWSSSNAGIGYSSVSVENGRLYTLGKRDDRNFLICLNSQNGAELWATPMGRGATR